MRALLIFISLGLGACTHTIPNKQEELKCLQVYKDEDGVMKYRDIPCEEMLRHRDPKI